MLGLDRRCDTLIVNPTPAVAGDLMPQLDQRADELRMPLERHRNAEHGEWQASALELADDSPHAGARSVLVDRLHAEMPIGVGSSADDLREELLGAGVTVQYVVLAALLVVEDELDGDTGPPGPLGLRWIAAIADQVTWVVVHWRRQYVGMIRKYIDPAHACGELGKSRKPVHSSDSTENE